MVAIQFALGAAVLCWEFGWAIDACFNSLVGIRAFQAIELTNIYDVACEIVFLCLPSIFSTLQVLEKQTSNPRFGKVRGLGSKFSIHCSQARYLSCLTVGLSMRPCTQVSPCLGWTAGFELEIEHHFFSISPLF